LEGEIIMLAKKGGCHVPSDKLSLFTLGHFEIYQSERGSYTASARTTKLWDLFKYIKVKELRRKLYLKTYIPMKSMKTLKTLCRILFIA
jgi:hypothetical protein